MTASAGKYLPKPSSVVTNEDSVDIISPAIQLSIKRIAQFVVTVRKRKLFLSRNTTFDVLLDVHASNRHTNQHRYEPSALGKEHSQKGYNQKVPAFTVPKFSGKSLDGQEYVDNVTRKFKGNVQLFYLEDADFCDDHPAWSEAFSSRLLDSLTDSDIFGYLLTE